MPRKSIPVISIVHVDFASLVNQSDAEIIQLVQYAINSSKKRLLPKSVKHDRLSISRGPNHVTLHLYMGNEETARVGFVPSPDFSR